MFFPAMGRYNWSDKSLLYPNSETSMPHWVCHEIERPRFPQELQILAHRECICSTHARNPCLAGKLIFHLCTVMKIRVSFCRFCNHSIYYFYQAGFHLRLNQHLQAVLRVDLFLEQGKHYRLHDRKQV